MLLRVTGFQIKRLFRRPSPAHIYISYMRRETGHTQLLDVVFRPCQKRSNRASTRNSHVPRVSNRTPWYVTPCYTEWAEQCRNLLVLRVRRSCRRLPIKRRLLCMHVAPRRLGLDSGLMTHTLTRNIRHSHFPTSSICVPTTDGRCNTSLTDHNYCKYIYIYIYVAVLGFAVFVWSMFVSVCCGGKPPPLVGKRQAIRTVIIVLLLCRFGTNRLACVFFFSVFPLFLSPSTGLEPHSSTFHRLIS